MRTERENCCDDVVVSVSAMRTNTLSPSLRSNATVFARQAAVAATGGNLVKRIRRLLYPKTNGPWAPFLAVTILIATGVVSLAAWGSQPYQSSPSAVQSEQQRTLGPIYTKWLESGSRLYYR